MVHKPQIHIMILSILSDKSFKNDTKKIIKPLYHMTMFLRTQNEWQSEWFYWLTKDQFLKHLIFDVLKSDNLSNIESALWLLSTLEGNTLNQESILIKYNMHKIIKQIISKWSAFYGIICHCILVISQMLKNDKTRDKILDDSPYIFDICRDDSGCVVWDLWTETSQFLSLIHI